MTAARPRAVRVVLTGSESTGKTTLAARLARDHQAPWVPEYARCYAAAAARPLDARDVEPIARGQIALADAALRDHPLVFLDTDLVSTVVYARHYYGGCPPWIERAARERRGELYLLLHPDVPWVADPERDRPHERGVLHAMFDAELRAVGARVTHVAGGWAERATLASRAVAAVLGRDG